MKLETKKLKLGTLSSLALLLVGAAYLIFYPPAPDFVEAENLVRPWIVSWGVRSIDTDDTQSAADTLNSLSIIDVEYHRNLFRFFSRRSAGRADGYFDVRYAMDGEVMDMELAASYSAVVGWRITGERYASW